MSTSKMVFDSISPEWFQEKLNIFANELQAEKNKVSALEIQIKQQNVLITTISEEKENALLQITKFIQKMKEENAKPKPKTSDLQELRESVATWERRNNQNLAAALKYRYEKNEALLDVKVLKEQSDLFKAENDLLKSKMSDLSKKLLILENDCGAQIEKLTAILNERNEQSDSIKELKEKVLKSKSDEIILQKKISDLESDLKNKTKCFDEEKIMLLDAIRSLKDASKVLQKEKNGLMTSHDVLTQKLDKRSQPKEIVPEKIHTGVSSKNVSKKFSQFTNYSLQKTQKYSEKLPPSGTSTSLPFLSFSDNASHILHAYNQRANRVWKHQSVSKTSTHAKSFKYSFSKLFELAPRPVCPSVHKMNDFGQRTLNDFKTPLIPPKSFQNETPCFNSRWNATSLHQIDTTYKWFSKVSNAVGPVLKWVPKVVLK